MSEFGFGKPEFKNYCSKVLSVSTNLNKTEIRLDSIFRDIHDFGMPRYSVADGIVGTSVLGKNLVFSGDSVYSTINNTKFLWHPSKSQSKSFTFFENDTIGFISKKINVREAFVNGFKDSLTTYEIKLKKGVFPNGYTGPNRYYYTIAKNLGFVEVPDLYQIYRLAEANTVKHFRLKFASSPKVGYSSLFYESFYNYDVGDIFYQTFFSSTIPNYTFKKIIEKEVKDSVIEYKTFNGSFRPSSPLGNESYEEGFGIDIINRFNSFRSPETYTSSNFWAYSNIFYVNDRVCLEFQNSFPYYFDSTYQYYTIFEAELGMSIYCEGLGRVEVYNSTYNISSGLFDYKKGDEVLTSTEGLPINEPQAKYLVSPNPTSSYFKIQTDDRVLSIQIFDANGKKVKVIDHPNNNLFSITDLSPGFYFVEINTNSVHKTEKLIIE